MKRTKTTAIIKNVIGDSAKEELTELLKNNKFSILTDESTDIGTVKTYCVVVRYFIFIFYYFRFFKYIYCLILDYSIKVLVRLLASFGTCIQFLTR